MGVTVTLYLYAFVVYFHSVVDHSPAGESCFEAGAAE